jgi:hypothetical protein
MRGWLVFVVMAWGNAGAVPNVDARANARTSLYASALELPPSVAIQVDGCEC